MLRHSIESIEVKDEKASKFRRQMDKWSLTRNITGACQGSMITVVELRPNKLQFNEKIIGLESKVEKILKGSLDSIPSLSP